VYEQFFGLSARPFSLAPDPRFLLMTHQHEIAFIMLEYGITGDSPITVLTGEVGSGKTTLLRHLVSQLDPSLRVGIVSHTHRDSGAILRWVAVAFGLEVGQSDEAALYQAFRRFMQVERGAGRQLVLVIDEAQNLGAERLEELRVFSNLNEGGQIDVQLILVGQPELRDTLRRPELRQLTQRIGADYHLSALQPEQTAAYIRHRVAVAHGPADLFSGRAIEIAHEHSGGIPRLINQLCNSALVFGFAHRSTRIDGEIMAHVVRSRTDGGLLPTGSGAMQRLDGSAT